MDEILKMVLGLLAALLTAVTPLLVAYLVKYLQNQLHKVGLEATDQELDTIRKIAEEGIAFAAQQAKVKMKGDGKSKLTSADKKALALAFSKKLASKYGVDAGKVDLLEDLLESALAKPAADKL